MKKSGKEIVFYLAALIIAMLILGISCIYYYNRCEQQILLTVSYFIFADIGLVIVCIVLALLFDKKNKK